MLIVYCETCGFRISADELNNGKAVQATENKYNCAKCAATAILHAKRASTSGIPTQPRRTPEGGQRPPSGGTAAISRPKSAVMRPVGAQTAVSSGGDGAAPVVRKPFPVVPAAAGAATVLVVVVVVFALSSGPKDEVALNDPAKKSGAGTAGSTESKPKESTPTSGAAPLTAEERVRRAMEDAAKQAGRGQAPATKQAANATNAPAGNAGGLGMLANVAPVDDSIYNTRGAALLKEVQEWYAQNGADPWGYKEKLEQVTHSYRSSPAGQEARKLLAELKLPPESERPQERMNWHKDWKISEGAREVGFHGEFDGRKFVYQSHPIDQGKPCVTARTLNVPESRPLLEIRIRGHDAGDHRFAVKVAGQELLSENVGGKEWRSFVLDLTVLKGKNVEVALYHHNTGWACEHAYLQVPRFIDKPAANSKIFPWKGGASAVQEANSPGVIDALALVDAGADAIHGEWKRTSEGLESTSGKDHRIQIPLVPPQEYDYSVTFTRKTGNNALVLVGSRGDRDFLGMLSGWGGKYVHLSGINGLPIEQNPTRRDFGERIKNGRKHTAVLEVRNEGLRLLLDGEALAEWKTTYGDMAAERSWKARDPYALVLGAFECVYLIHAIEVREIGGVSRPLRGVLARKAAGNATVSKPPAADKEPASAKRDEANSSAADYAALSDDAYAAMSKGNLRAGKEIFEKMLADARFAGSKAKIENDLALVKLAETNARALAKGAQALTDNRPFAFQQTTGKAVYVGRGTKNAVKDATETLITIEQDLGGGKALTRIAVEQLMPLTRFELARIGTEKEPEGSLNAALGALLLVRSGQSEFTPRAIRALLDAGKKTPVGEKLSAHLAERFEASEREGAAEQAFHKTEQAVAANKMEEARKLLDAFGKDHAATAFASRRKEQVKKLGEAVSRALTPLNPGLVWEYCQPDGGERFKTVKVTKVEPKLSYDWGDNEPVTGAPRDFSVRAKGVLRAEKGGRYGFWIRADDYGVVKINGQRVAEAPSNNTGEGEIELSVGDHAIEIEFQDTGGAGVLQIRWRLVGAFDTQDIPESALLHDPRKLSGK